MSSNLPPGCTSPDGGIDHAWEAAIEAIGENDTDVLLALAKLAPIIEQIQRQKYDEGIRDGEMGRRSDEWHNLGIPDPAALVESYAELLEFAKLAKDEGYHSPSRVSRMIARAEAARGEP